MLVEMARFYDPIGVQIAAGALRAAGIEVVLLDAALSGAMGGALVPARLMVDASDERAARMILDAAALPDA